MSPFYPDVCINIVIANHIGKEAINSITFVLKNVTTYDVRLFIEDKNLAGSRPVIKNQLLIKGDNIEIVKQKSGQERESKTYSVSFSKNIFMEEDISKNCKNYPNKEYETYKGCEDFFVHDFFGTYGQLSPIWAWDQSRNISTNVFISNLTSEFEHHLTNVITGVKPLKCKQPCTTVRVS